MDHPVVLQMHQINQVCLLSSTGCGVDWAVTPLSRIASVAYLVIGAPILYLYLTSAGRALSAALHFIGYQVGVRDETPTCNKIIYLFN